MVYSLVAVYILCVVPRLFSLNQIAIPGVLTLFTLPYLTACIFCNDVIHCHTQPGNLHVVVCVHFRTIIVSVRHLLAGKCNAFILEIFSYLFPSTFGINGYVRINSMGATLNEVALNTAPCGCKPEFTSSPPASSTAGKSYKAERITLPCTLPGCSIPALCCCQHDICRT